MPLYEYECKKCGHRFERIQKFSDKPVTRCPECGGKVEKLLHAPAVQFKGSGWYVTDYARKSSGSSSDGSSKSENKQETKAEKSEAKEEKKEAKPKTEKSEKKKS